MKREELLDESVLLAQDALVHAMAVQAAPRETPVGARPGDPRHNSSSPTPPPAGVASANRPRAAVGPDASCKVAIEMGRTSGTAREDGNIRPGRCTSQSEQSPRADGDGGPSKHLDVSSLSDASEHGATPLLSSTEGSALGGGGDRIRSRQARKMQRLLCRIEQVKTRKGLAFPIHP